MRGLGNSEEEGLKEGSAKSGGTPAMHVALFTAHCTQLPGAGGVRVAAGTLRKEASVFMRAKCGGAAFISGCCTPRWGEWLTSLLLTPNIFIDLEPKRKQSFPQPGCPNKPSLYP